MFDFIIESYSNSALVKFFFWGPVVFNMVVYPFHVWARVQKDRKTIKKWLTDVADQVELNKHTKSTYLPTLYTDSFVTIGSLFGYFFLTFLPVLNGLATIFHAAPIAWDYLEDRFKWLFRIKLVGTPTDRG